MQPRPTKVIYEIISKDSLFARHAALTHHPLGGSVERDGKHLHLTRLLVLGLQLTDWRARQAQLLLDPPQTQREDGRKCKIRAHVCAGHANLEARRRRRHRWWGDDADRRSA